LFVCLFVCLSVCLFVCLSVCLFVCLSVCLFVCLFVYLFIITLQVDTNSKCTTIIIDEWLSVTLANMTMGERVLIIVSQLRTMLSICLHDRLSSKKPGFVRFFLPPWITFFCDFILIFHFIFILILFYFIIFILFYYDLFYFLKIINIKK
jgi:hypothetical protein